MYIIKGKNNDYEVVIGLEVHAQINTITKLFSESINCFIENPNTNICEFDIATPGKLPLLNKEAVKKAILTGLAINGTIEKYSRFDRKHYFYPDLPQGYQITQFYHPIVTNGTINIKTNDKKEKIIRIERIHIEQDAGKMIHGQDENSYIDYNRAGIPLMEIVSKPDLSSPDEAIEYLKKLRNILRFAKTSDADLEKGTFRCDANVSVRIIGSKILGTRCEIKNLNSFKFIAQAIEYEAKRQIEVIESGQIIEQQTRLFDTITNTTKTMRDKANAVDYRYFPDPDLLSLILTDEEINQIKTELPELPEAKAKKYEKLGLSQKEIEFLCSEPKISEYFDKINKMFDIKMCNTWILNELLGKLQTLGIIFENNPISETKLIELMELIQNNTINGKIGKEVLDDMITSGNNAKDIIKNKGLEQIIDIKMITKIVQNVINENQKQVEQYLSGNERLFGFFVGQVLKQTEGKANPKIINEILKNLLKK